MIIYGAGMAGLLAARMLQHHAPVVAEAQEALPNNHAALLRFRSTAVSDATHIPFKKVKVQKAIYHDGSYHSQSNLYFSNLYSLKVSGSLRDRSILDISPGERYIAPPDFIPLLAAGQNIKYCEALKAESLDPTRPIISTVPMPVLMSIVGWEPMPVFNYTAIWSISGIISGDIDVYQTIYFPGHPEQYYRASITGNRLIIEYTKQPDDYRADCRAVLEIFGIDAQHAPIEMEFKNQKYGKLVPIDNASRKQFILAMTDKYNIYSVGRFATWRQILLDDVVKDIRIVRDMLESRDSYQRHLRGIS